MVPLLRSGHCVGVGIRADGVTLSLPCHPTCRLRRASCAWFRCTAWLCRLWASLPPSSCCGVPGTALLQNLPGARQRRLWVFLAPEAVAAALLAQPAAQERGRWRAGQPPAALSRAARLGRAALSAAGRHRVETAAAGPLAAVAQLHRRAGGLAKGGPGRAQPRPATASASSLWCRRAMPLRCGWRRRGGWPSMPLRWVHCGRLYRMDDILSANTCLLNCCPVASVGCWGQHATHEGIKPFAFHGRYARLVCHLHLALTLPSG